MPIKLSELIPIECLEKYKSHCGVKTMEGYQPLDAFVNGEWDKWQEPWGRKNRFNRQYIFTMMRSYHEEDTWFFGGIYRVKDENKVELTDQGEEYIGRLKLKFKLKSRNIYPNLENIYDNIEVVDILPEPYDDETF